MADTTQDTTIFIQTGSEETTAAEGKLGLLEKMDAAESFQGGK
jgi:hypothetical protein